MDEPLQGGAENAAPVGGVISAEVAVALEVVARINAHDVTGLLALMSDDHRFVDSLGREIAGREAMRGPWQGYFAWFPDYWIEVTRTFSAGGRSGEVALFGSAGGTYAAAGGPPRPELAWRAPAAWRALRAEIAGALLESLEPEPEVDVESAWRQEVAARVAALEAGEVETVPWDEVRDRLLARLGARRQG